MRKSTVGKSSSRTPFKHWVLNVELGRLCGIFANPRAACKVPARANPFLVIDLCAGDGDQTDDSDSSPQIILKHLRWAASRNVQVQSVMCERHGATFRTLTDNVQPKPAWLDLIRGDARELNIKTGLRQAVFIHSDPNDIAGWPITRGMIEGMSETTTMLCTLGCNVGGLKRMSHEDRVKWYDHVGGCLDAMPAYHDAILIALEGDRSQWAYLLRLPRKWSHATADNIVRVGSRYTAFNLTIASYRDSPIQFSAMEDTLFLTKKERAQS